MIKPMTLAEAYAAGRAWGHKLAAAVLSQEPTIGLYDDGESFYEAIGDTDEHARQYSPFEFTAAAINARPHDDGYPEGWERFDAGCERGVLTECKRRGRYDLV